MPSKTITREIDTTVGTFNVEIDVSMPAKDSDYFSVDHVRITGDYDRGLEDAIVDEVVVFANGRGADSIFDELSGRAVLFSGPTPELLTPIFGSPEDAAVIDRAKQIVQETGCSLLDAVKQAKGEVRK